MNLNDKKAAQIGSGNLAKYGMWACCAVMLLPIIAYFATGGTSGVTESLITFSPLVLCVGAHLVMHRFMGNSCHGKAQNTDDKNADPEGRATARIAAE